MINFAQLVAVGLYWSMTIFPKVVSSEKVRLSTKQIKGSNSQTGNLIDKIPLPWETTKNILSTPDPLGDTIDVVDQSMVRTVTDQVNIIESSNQSMVRPVPKQVNMAEPHNQSMVRTVPDQVNMAESHTPLHTNKHTNTEGINRNSEGKLSHSSKQEISRTPLQNVMNDTRSTVIENKNIDKLIDDNSGLSLTAETNVQNAISAKSNVDHSRSEHEQNRKKPKPIIGAADLNGITDNVAENRNLGATQSLNIGSNFSIHENLSKPIIVDTVFGNKVENMPQQNRNTNTVKSVNAHNLNIGSSALDRMTENEDRNIGPVDLLRVASAGLIDNQDVQTQETRAAGIHKTMQNLDRNQNFGIVTSVNVANVGTAENQIKNAQTPALQAAGLDTTTRNGNENPQFGIMKSVNVATAGTADNQIEHIHKSPIQPADSNGNPETAARNQHSDNEESLINTHRLGTTASLLQNFSPILTRNLLNPHRGMKMGLSERIFSDFNKDFKFSSPLNQVTNIPNISDGHFNFKTNFSHSHASGHSTNFDMSWDADKLQLHSANTSFTREKQAQHKTIKTATNITSISDKSEHSQNKQINARVHKNADKIKVSNKQDLKGFDTIERTGHVLSDGLNSVNRHNRTKHTHALDRLELNNNEESSSGIHQNEKHLGATIPLVESGGIGTKIKLHDTIRNLNTKLSSNWNVLDNNFKTRMPEIDFTPSLMKSNTGIPFAPSSDKSMMMQAVAKSASDIGSQQNVQQDRNTFSNNKWITGSPVTSDFPTKNNFFKGQKNNRNFHFKWNTNSNIGPVDQAKIEPMVHKSASNSLKHFQEQRQPNSGNFQSSWQKSWWTTS